MKSGWIWFWVCAVLGVLDLTCGWMVPAYLRAVDSAVLEKAGKRTTTLAERGLQFVKEDKLGPAELLLAAARSQAISDRAQLGLAVTNLAVNHPGWRAWGGGEKHLEILFGGTDTKTLTEWIVRLENRGKILELLKASPQPLARQLLQCRALTNTVIFPPSQSSSGQAIDAAISICGLLVAEGSMSGGLSNALFALAAAANQTGNSLPLEQVLLDFMSLGQRFNWTELATLASMVESPQALRVFAERIRKNEQEAPELYAAIMLSKKPAEVARFLTEYSQTGIKDLGETLRFGEGGINELLRRQAPVHHPLLRQQLEQKTPLGAVSAFAVDYAWRSPWVALAIKWLLYLVAGFLFAVAFHFALPPVSGLELPLQVRGFHLARELLFSLGFLTVVLLLSEPFLAQENQKAEFAFRVHLPTQGNAVASGVGGVKSSFMDPKSLLTLLLFFVLQALIYFACLVKLAEIRRQRVTARIKLRLLENEDHLFDAGLYLGFAGTIISLILVSLGVIKPSLMAAYSSTSFGIIFVSVFKIFHLRPERRRLLLEAESVDAAQATASAAPSRPLAAPL